MCRSAHWLSPAHSLCVRQLESKSPMRLYDIVLSVSLIGAVLFVAAHVSGWRASNDSHLLSTAAPVVMDGAAPARERREPDRAVRLDTIRVDPGGPSVFAGRTLPHARVVLSVDHLPVGAVAADGRGTWSLVAEMPSIQGPFSITLQAELPDGTVLLSDNPIMVGDPGQP